MRRIAAISLSVMAAACVPSSVETADSGRMEDRAQVVQPIATPAPSPTPTGPSTFVYDGELTQGGWIRGQVPAGTVSARLGEQELDVDESGRFFAAFDRDAGPTTALVARRGDGQELRSPLTISPRDWDIERVNVARTAGGASEAFMRIRRPELARIVAARAQETGASGWSQGFIWPATGRISGRFGSQRFYRQLVECLNRNRLLRSNRPRRKQCAFC